MHPKQTDNFKTTYVSSIFSPLKNITNPTIKNKRICVLPKRIGYALAAVFCSILPIMGCSDDSDNKISCNEHEIEFNNSCVCNNSEKYYGIADGCMLCDDTQKIVKDNACVWKDTTINSSLYAHHLNKGEIVTFGRYPQATEMLEPIEWIVLDVKDNGTSYLLLSKYVIDAKEYSIDYPTGWRESSIRTWLNDEESGFLSNAFDSNELSKIVTVSNSTTGSGFNDGSTKDRVFLLDKKDVIDSPFFDNCPNEGACDSRLAYATTYAVERINIIKNYSGGDCGNIQCHADWWLRSCGSTSICNFDSSSCVTDYGNVTDVFIAHKLGIRPALWVKAD